MSQSDYPDNNSQRLFDIQKRSLNIVLVLSIIGSGLNFLSSLIWGVTLPTMQQMFNSGAITMPDSMTVAIEEFLNTPRSFFLWSALLYAVSLAGVILMWRLQKIGFHLYTLAQLFVLLITVLFLGKERLPLGDVMFTLLFVTYYYFALRRLGVFSYNQATPENGNNPTGENSDNPTGDSEA